MTVWPVQRETRSMRAIALRIGSIIGMPVMVAIWLLLIGPMLAIGGMYRWSDAGLVILPLLGVAAIGSRIVARRGLAVGLTGLAVMWVSACSSLTGRL